MKTLLAAALLLASAASASAADLQPLQGGTIDLGAVRGVAYYTVQPDDAYALVATFTSETGAPMRVAASLDDGETMTVMLPAAADGAAPSVDFVRTGSVLRVAERTVPTN